MRHELSTYRPRNKFWRNKTITNPEDDYILQIDVHASPRLNCFLFTGLFVHLRLRLQSESKKKEYKSFDGIYDSRLFWRLRTPQSRTSEFITRWERQRWGHILCRISAEYSFSVKICIQYTHSNALIWVNVSSSIFRFVLCILFSHNLSAPVLPLVARGCHSAVLWLQSIKLK